MTQANYFEVTFTSFFSKQTRTTVVKARNEREALANAKNIRPMHDYSNATVKQVEKQETAKGVGANHNNA